jgi:hypothetical protein
VRDYALIGGIEKIFKSVKLVSFAVLVAVVAGAVRVVLVGNRVTTIVPRLPRH